MKFKHYVREHRVEGELIVSFGEARLIKLLNGKFGLGGGTDEDRAEAREWMSRFMPGKENAKDEFVGHGVN